jgi:hypothetical protein
MASCKNRVLADGNSFVTDQLKNEWMMGVKACNMGRNKAKARDTNFIN